MLIQLSYFLSGADFYRSNLSCYVSFRTEEEFKISIFYRNYWLDSLWNQLCSIWKWFSFCSTRRYCLVIGPKNNLQNGLVKIPYCCSDCLDYHHCYRYFVAHSYRSSLRGTKTVNTGNSRDTIIIVVF